MKVLLQRVLSASVEIDGEQISAIGPGLVALVGVFPDDSSTAVDWLATKTLGLRIFPDAEAEGKNMNRSVVDTGGEILVVSQFTLAADTSRGMRPGFSEAASPDHAEAIYESYAEKLATVVPVEMGRFGADMKVSLVNDGPVTIMLERE